MSNDAAKAVLAELSKGDAKLKQSTTKESSTLDQAKLISSLNKDHTKELKKVETHDAANDALSQAKLLLEVKKTPALKKVSTSGEGLTEAQKQAYLEEKKEQS